MPCVTHSEGAVRTKSVLIQALQLSEESWNLKTIFCKIVFDMELTLGNNVYQPCIWMWFLNSQLIFFFFNLVIHFYFWMSLILGIS